jgi:hypothetical protein
MCAEAVKCRAGTGAASEFALITTGRDFIDSLPLNIVGTLVVPDEFPGAMFLRCKAGIIG